MKDWLEFGRVIGNLRALGTRRLALLGVAAVAVVGLILGGSYFVSRPDFETIYVGLSPAEVARIGSVLKEAGIGFDVSLDGTKVGVARGQSGQARALLAQRGLPGSSGGYELFDKLGPAGLTSYMQEVTRVRALEGEISRTIQTIRGILSARVHIVLGEPGSFRRPPQQASASVVIKTEIANDASAVPAIRHIIAAAIPGLGNDRVRVLSSDGAVLAADADGPNSPTRLLELQKSVAAGIQDNIRRTLTPYLGLENFEVSVAVRLNTDQQQISETSFDPERKVERSTRVVREVGNAQNSGTRQNVSVEQNIPTEQNSTQGGDQSKKSSQKRDEVTNFEVPSRSTSTTTVGYRVEQITAAVVINKKRLAALAPPNAAADASSRQLAEVEQLVSSAGGLIASRGDRVSMAALDFVTDSKGADVSGQGLVELLAPHAGTALKSLAFIVVAFLLIQFGIRPLSRTLAETPQATLPAPPASAIAYGTPPGTAGGPHSTANAAAPQDYAAKLTAAIEARRGNRPADRLNQMVDLDQEQALAILRRWIREDDSA